MKVSLSPLSSALPQWWWSPLHQLVVINYKNGPKLAPGEVPQKWQLLLWRVTQIMSLSHSPHVIGRNWSLYSLRWLSVGESHWPFIQHHRVPEDSCWPQRHWELAKSMGIPLFRVAQHQCFWHEAQISLCLGSLSCSMLSSFPEASIHQMPTALPASVMTIKLSPDIAEWPWGTQ